MLSDDFLNKGLAQKAGNETANGFASKIDDFAVSTVTDIGTTLWNSVISIPKLIGIDTNEYRAETYDLLRNVNEDYANYYNEHKETVETASFLGGIFIPGGAAFKGMKLLQGGKLGYYPKVLTDISQERRITELNQMLAAGKGATKEFRDLRWKILSANAGQETMQMAGAEFAVLATMNQHIWMEDYLKDPLSNFAVSMALGGVIGTGIGQIYTRKILRDTLGETASAATDKVISKMISIPLGISDVDKVQRFNINSAILKDIAEDVTQNQLTRQIALDMSDKWQGIAGKLEQNTVFGPILKGSQDKAAMEGARKVMLSDAAFGANRVDLVEFDPKDMKPKFGKAKLDVFSSTNTEETSKLYKDLWEAGHKVRNGLRRSEALKTFKPEWEKLMKDDFITYYSPHHQAWIPQSEVKNYTRAVDTGIKNWDEKTNVHKINSEATFEFAVRGVPTAQADRMWIDTLGAVAATKIEHSGIFVHQGDLGVQNGWISRLNKMRYEEEKRLPKIFMVPENVTGSVSEMRKKAVEITLEQLEDNLSAQKERLARELLGQGASLQEISIRLNIPTSTLEHAFMSGKSIRDIGYKGSAIGPEGFHPWRMYHNAGSIQSEYLAQSGRMLQFTTNGHRVSSLAFRNADMSANLDGAKIKQQNRELMATLIAEGKSATAIQYYEILNKDDRIWEIFGQQLNNIVNEKSGSFFFGSADFASRDMGDISRIASIKGQEIIGASNGISQRLLTNLSNSVRSATSTQVGLNEFNSIINLLQGTSGYRNIDASTGLLYRQFDTEPGVTVREVLRYPDGRDLKLSDNMRNFLIEMQAVSRELWHMKNTINKIQGFKELSDIGLWIPSFNPMNKFISYVIDTTATENRVSLLVGKSPEELASLEAKWKSAHGDSKQFKLITKAQQEDYNFWQMRTDPTEMDFADINKFHSGASASALPVVDESFSATLIENLHNRVLFYGRKLQEMYLEDIMGTLDMMSAVNQKYNANQPTLARAIGLNQREDAARSIKNMLLGNSQLGAFSTWQSVNNGFASMIEFTSRKGQEFANSFFKYDESKRVLTKSEYVKYAKELEAHGVVNPFKNFDSYVSERDKISKSKSIQLEQDIEKYPDNYIINIKKDGKKIGELDLSTMSDGSFRDRSGEMYKDDNIFIDYIGTREFGKPMNLSTTDWREIGHQLKQWFPNAKTMSGERVSGSRGKLMDEGRLSLSETTGMKIPDYGGAHRFSDQLEQLRIDEVARKHNIDHPSAERIIAAGNSVLATLALRVMETGHALVTAISWPIMANAELMRNLPKTYLGNALGEGIQVAYPARAIYDGIRFRHSDAAKPLIKRWEEEGFAKSIVSEATQLNQLINQGGKGAIGQINKILESDLIKRLSRPSDFAEEETRAMVLCIGYQMARRAYPGITDSGADLFAKEFMTRTIGNYYSAQRPAMFQGTLGVAIGLFQTYMLTFAQSMYRSIEERQFKALAGQMLTQAGLFGMSTTPMYDIFSKTIGEHFSDKHYDLQSGTYRALPDQLAEFIVYGLPASLGVGLYTRGDIQPRIPFAGNNPLDTIAAINATRQSLGAMGHTLKKVYEAQGLTDKFAGLLEGMSMQSLSRPVARIVETVPLPDGQGGFRAVGSISREGNTIATSSEVWSVPGVLSRLVSSRSAEEQVKREVDYLNSFYGSIDHANRKGATERLKTAIRGGNLTPEKLEEVATEYLRTGTATGWKAALNEALATSEGGIDYKLGKRLRPDSPLMRMIDENY